MPDLGGGKGGPRNVFILKVHLENEAIVSSTFANKEGVAFANHTNAKFKLQLHFIQGFKP